MITIWYAIQQKLNRMKFIENITTSEKEALKEMMKNGDCHRMRIRAHAILLSAKRYKIEQIAGIFNVDRDTVSDWLRRWDEMGISGLNDASRSGRPKKDNMQ